MVLGWFGPGDADHPEFGELWRGATLALEQENAAGGYRGKPFRIVSAWSQSPWKAGILEVTKLVYGSGAWAVIGGVDGTTTHLAVQLALKSHFLLLSPGSTDTTADHANVPWLFSVPPSDDAISPLIAQRLATGTGRFALVAGTDHDSHAALVAVRRALGELRLTPAALVELPREALDLPAMARQVLEARPQVVVVLAGSTVAGRLVAELRRAGFAGDVIGGATLGGGAFARVAGDASEGVIAPSWVTTDNPEWVRFAQAYAVRWGRSPDASAAQGHDAVRLTVAAIRTAGLNRARIRDAVRGLSPWRGAVGSVEWNGLGRNEPRVRLGVWRGGRLQAGTTLALTLASLDCLAHRVRVGGLGGD